MPYRFKRKEAVPESVVRIVTEQTQHAAREIRGDVAGNHDGVHNARKSFKKIRSLLRMLRGEIGGTAYRALQHFFARSKSNFSRNVSISIPIWTITTRQSEARPR
jgi:hypothetical protein